MRKTYKTTILYLICLIILLLKTSLLRAETINVSNDLYSLKIGENLEYYEDRDAGLVLNDIIKKQITWKKSTEDSLTFGYIKSAYWVKFSIKNISSEDMNFYLGEHLYTYFFQLRGATKNVYTVIQRHKTVQELSVT